MLLKPRMAKLSQVPPKSLRRVMPLTKSTVSARRRAPRSSMSCWGTTRTAWGVSSRGVSVRVAAVLSCAPRQLLLPEVSRTCTSDKAGLFGSESSVF